MALIPLVAIVKLNLLLSCRKSAACNSMVACLLLPFLIKLSVDSYRRVHHTYSDFIYAFHLFFFQLARISAGEDQPPPPNPNGGDSRWRRALRLVFRRLREAASSSSAVDVEDSLHSLSMLTL